MATLTVPVTDDFSADLLSNIDIIEFTNVASATATFAALQFDNAAILDGVTLIGNGQTNAVEVRGGSVDASGWQFTGWSNTADLITLEGSTAADVITGPSRRATLSGLEGRDTLTGGGRDDTISGGTGADKITGGLGADVITGEGGNDTIKYTDGSDASGAESVDGGAGSDLLLLQNVEEPIVFIAATITRVERLEYRQSADAYFLSEHFMGKNGISEVTYGAGNDRLTIQGADFDLSGLVINNYGAAGTDALFLSGTDPSGCTITGTDYSQWIYGDSGDDSLTGGSQADILAPRMGTDSVAGGGGNDVWLIFDPDEISAGDSFDGGADFDEVYVLEDAAEYTYDFRGFALTGVEALNINDNPSNTAPVNVILDGAQIGNGAITLVRVNSETHITVEGSSIDVSAVNFYNPSALPFSLALTGGAGKDAITGSDKDDLITGGLDGDTLTGGGGADHFIYEDLTDSTSGQGRDVIADFVQGADAIEIVPALGFTFLGTAAFSGKGDAEIRITAAGSDTVVNIDGDGDGAAESKFVLTGSYTMTEADFILS